MKTFRDPSIDPLVAAEPPQWLSIYNTDTSGAKPEAIIPAVDRSPDFVSRRLSRGFENARKTVKPAEIRVL
jgi:hypothetical protein